MSETPVLITQTEIMLREGWSRTILRNLLGDPDLRKKIYGRSNPACLYHLSRVIAAEATREFADAQELLAKRKASSIRAVNTKIDKLMSDIAVMSVSVKAIKLDCLQQLAIDAYNDWNNYRDPASRHSDKAFIDRICVNFIRHELTEYDRALWKVAGRTGKNIAVAAIRMKVFAAITVAYPMFHSECNRQLVDRCETE